LLDYPRSGERLKAYQPGEVRRISVGDYEMRYEVAGGTVFILRVALPRES